MTKEGAQNHSPNQSIDLDRVDVVQLPQCLLNLHLVGLDVADEHERVVLLDLLHGRLSVEWVDEHFVCVQTRLMGN